MSAVVYDKWRADYPSLSTKEHAAFYDDKYTKDPNHASFSGRAVRYFFNQANCLSYSVAEIGGRNGSLAKVALEFTPAIKRWVNYEISGAAVAGTLTQDSRYEAKLMTDFCWWMKEPIEGDLLILSHIIEHISDSDFKSLVAVIPKNIRGVHVQSPLAMRGPIDWTGNKGCHILTMGWVEVDQEFVVNGFKSITAYDGASWVRR